MSHYESLMFFLHVFTCKNSATRSRDSEISVCQEQLLHDLTQEVSEVPTVDIFADLFAYLFAYFRLV